MLMYFVVQWTCTCIYLNLKYRSYRCTRQCFTCSRSWIYLGDRHKIVLWWNLFNKKKYASALLIQFITAKLMTKASVCPGSDIIWKSTRNSSLSEHFYQFKVIFVWDWDVLKNEYHVDRGENACSEKYLYLRFSAPSIIHKIPDLSFFKLFAVDRKLIETKVLRGEKNEIRSRIDIT